MKDRRLGQVFTPPPVADLTLALALERARPGATILDPACGDGVFLHRAVRAGIEPSRVYGLDIDPARVAMSRSSGCHVGQGDLLDASFATAFDVIVGNPPYVRHELCGAAMKLKIERALAMDWPELSARTRAGFHGRADLALAFVARALKLVRPGGRVAFVVSQAALDANYGELLRTLLSGRADLVAVVTSADERWFADAAIHAAVIVLERHGEEIGRDTSIAKLKVPIARAAAMVHSVRDLEKVAEVRYFCAALGKPLRQLLRAPSVWQTVSLAAEDSIVPLDELASIRRGATSGANAFFYLEREAAHRRRIEPQFLAPLLRTPRTRASITVTPTSLDTMVFVCPLPYDELAAFPIARAYVDEHAELASMPTLAARPRWWSLPVRSAQLFLTKAYDARFGQLFATSPLIADQRVYAVEPMDVDVELLAAILNGTLTALALESLGRASMGDGALEWSVADARMLPVLDARRFGPRASRRVVDAFRSLCARPVLRIEEEILKTDRRELDEALLSIAKPALREMYADICQALKVAVGQRVRAEGPRRVLC